RSDESADALNRFGNERGDVAAGAGLNEIFDVFRAGHAAVGIFQAERTAVAIRTDGVSHADADDSGGAPGTLGGDRLRKSGGAGIAAPRGNYVERSPRRTSTA